MPLDGSLAPLPSTLANKWAFPDCVALLTLPMSTIPGTGGRGTRDGGWGRGPHHFLLQLIQLPVLPFHIFKESACFFHVYLSSEANAWSEVQVLVPALLLPLLKYKDLVLSD